MNTPFNSTCRRGWTLIEMSVVILLTALVLGMSVTLLTSLSGIHHRAIDRATARTEMNRLTDTMRRDLRLADTVQQPNDTTLVLESETAPAIHYVLDNEACHRTREATSDRTAEYERFAVGPALAWQMEQPQESSGDWPSTKSVTIQWAPRRPHESPPPPLQIVASQSFP